MPENPITNPPNNPTTNIIDSFTENEILSEICAIEHSNHLIPSDLEYLNQLHNQLDTIRINHLIPGPMGLARFNARTFGLSGRTQ